LFTLALFDLIVHLSV